MCSLHDKIYFGPSTTCFGKRGQDFTIPRTTKGITILSFRSRKTGRGTQKVNKESGPKDVPNYTQPIHIAFELGTKPPVGAWIAKDPVCRDCMTSAEEISMRRGFVDPISAKETERNEHVCTRCGKKIPAGS